MSIGAFGLFFGFAAGVGLADTPPRNYTGNCTDAGCHAPLAARKVTHDPVGSGDCDSCHVQEGDAHTFKLIADETELCLECHDTFEGEVEHGPAAEGECLSCHDPHGSTTAALIRGDTQAAVCIECHDDVTEDHAYVHGPAAAGDCSTCHEPHAGAHAKLLVAKGPELCLKCHAAFAKRTAAHPNRHDPLEEGCLNCHLPHGAANKAMLTETSPALCYDCHDAIAEAVEDATIKHSAVTQAGGCARCHDPHSSAADHLLADDTRTVCLRCHDHEIETPNGKLADFKKLLAESAVEHGPIADGDCTSCHAAVHGGERKSLLGGAYPAAFYAKWSTDAYALCFDCHDAEAFEEPTTDDATAFRNGEQNLHQLHTGRATKGRACRACHLIHGSKADHLLAETVPFGQWQLPIGFSGNETGGTCQSGCHRVYRYDRENPVTNIARSAPSATTAGAAEPADGAS